jgi:hypothetical protein
VSRCALGERAGGAAIRACGCQRAKRGARPLSASRSKPAYSVAI